MWETSKMPLAPRTARCSSRAEPYRSGMSQPAKAPIFAPSATWRSWSEVCDWATAMSADASTRVRSATPRRRPPATVPLDTVRGGRQSPRPMPPALRIALPAAAAAAAALALAGTAAGAAPTLDTARLGPDGLGPVKIGMTLDQARAATSSKLRVTQRDGSCAVLEQVGLYDGVYFLMTDDVIRTATISSTTSVNFTNITTKGLRLVAS